MRAIVKLTIHDNGNGNKAFRVRIPIHIGEEAGLQGVERVLVEASKGKITITPESKP